MSNPYINTKLRTNIKLYPTQMNNDIYNNLRRKLIKKLENKCFGEYGYIIKIYKLLTYENGEIEAENITASASFDVTFSCRLCIPLKGITILGEIERLNKELVRIKNGPILAVVTNDRINPEIFFKDNYRNLRYKKNNKSNLLKVGDFVKINIIQTTFYSGDEIIFVLGFLENLADDNEIEQYYKAEYNNEIDKFVDYKSFIEDIKNKKQEKLEQLEAESV